MPSSASPPELPGQPEQPAGARLWEMVLADLRDRLNAGEFADRFPSDRELTARYGVSRHTVREAVRQLAVVQRRPRLGGQVRATPSALATLVGTLKALGIRITLAELPAVRRRSVSVAGLLGLPDRRPIEVTLHVLLADGKPLLRSELWSIPSAPAIARDAGALIELDGSAAPGVTFRDQRTLPLTPDREVRDALELPAGGAVFSVEALVYVDGQPAAWHRAHVRPDRYPCVVQFAPGAPGVPA